MSPFTDGSYLCTQGVTMAASYQSPVGLKFLGELPEALFAPELIFGIRLFLLAYLETLQTDWSQKLTVLSAVAGIVTLGLFVTFYYKIEGKYCWRFMNVVSQLLLFSAYSTVFVMYMPTADIRTNVDAMYAATLCGGLMLLHLVHAVFSIVQCGFGWEDQVAQDMVAP